MHCSNLSVCGYTSSQKKLHVNTCRVYNSTLANWHVNTSSCYHQNSVLAYSYQNRHSYYVATFHSITFSIAIPAVCTCHTHPVRFMYMSQVISQNSQTKKKPPWLMHMSRTPDPIAIIIPHPRPIA